MRAPPMTQNVAIPVAELHLFVRKGGTDYLAVRVQINTLERLCKETLLHQPVY